MSLQVLDLAYVFMQACNGIQNKTLLQKKLVCTYVQQRNNKGNQQERL